MKTFEMAQIDPRISLDCMELSDGSLISEETEGEANRLKKIRHLYQNVDTSKDFEKTLNALRKSFSLEQFKEEFLVFVKYVTDTFLTIDYSTIKNQAGDVLNTLYLVDFTLEHCIRASKNDVFTKLVSAFDIFRILEVMISSGEDNLVIFCFNNILPKYSKIDQNFQSHSKEKIILLNKLKHFNKFDIINIAFDFFICQKMSDDEDDSLFWSWLSNNLVENHIMDKQVLLLLKRGVHFFAQSRDDDFKEIWSQYTMLLEMSGKEDPQTLKSILNILDSAFDKFEWNWKFPLLDLLLNNVNFANETIIFLLTRDISFSKNFSNIVCLMLDAFNNVCSYTDRLLTELKTFIRRSPENFQTWCEQSLLIDWCPPALWQFCKCTFGRNRLTKIDISVDLYRRLAAKIASISDIYIQDNAMDLLSMYAIRNCKTSDGEDTLQFLKHLQSFQPLMMTEYLARHERKIIKIIPLLLQNFEAGFEACIELGIKLNLIKIEDKLPESDLLYHQLYKQKLIDFDVVLEYVDDRSKNALDFTANSIALIAEIIPKMTDDNFNKYFDSITESDCNFKKALIFMLCKEYKNTEYFRQVISFYSFDNVEVWCLFIDIYFQLKLHEDVELFDVLDLFEEALILFKYDPKVLCKIIVCAEYMKSDLNFGIYLEKCLYKIKSLQDPASLRTCLKFFIEWVYSDDIVKEKTEFIEKCNKMLIKCLTVYDDLAYTLLEKIERLTLSLKMFLPILTNLFLGIGIGKHERSLHSTYQDILRVNGYDCQNPNVTKDDIRLMALNIIYIGCKEDSSTADLMVSKLLELYVQPNRDQDRSYFLIQKIRILQTILIIQDLMQVKKNTLLEFILERFYEGIEESCIQHLLQWMLIRLLKTEKPDNGIDNWGCSQFAKIVENFQFDKINPCFVITLIPVIYHWLLHNKIYELWELALKYLLICTMRSDVTVKVYAQYVLKKLKGHNLLSDQRLSWTQQIFNAVELVFQENEEYFDMILKNDKKILDNLNIINHFSIETILVDLPKLNRVLRSEWENVLSFGFPEKFDVKFLNTDPSFSKCIPTLNEDIVITPNVIIKEHKLDNTFILVATFIEDSSILSKLLKLCNDFGIKLVVNRDLGDMEELKKLNMASENQSKILQMEQKNLRLHILELKKSGYEVITTAREMKNKTLLQFDFRKKTVLILGNENAIPNEFAHLIDNFLEIPQITDDGHTPATLIVWEYARQHIFP